MTGATATAIAVSVGGAVAGQAAGAILHGGGGGGGSGISGGGGGGIQANEQKFYGSNASNPFYGVNVSTKPMEGAPPPKNPEMPINKGEPSKGRVTSARETPTQAVGTETAQSDYRNIWADRLSKYLDYNTRALG